MDLLQLQYFRTIASCGSLTKAANLLFVSQPNLSTGMTRLETDLGVKLFHRRKGKIELTENGKLFLEYVNRSLDELDSGIAAVRQRENLDSKTINMVSSQGDIVADIFRCLEDLNNEIQIKLMTCTNDRVFDYVLNESVDFGLMYGKPKNTALEYKLIATSPRILVVHNAHRFAQRKSVSVNELREERFICNNYRDDQEFFEGLFREYGLKVIAVCECDNLHTEMAFLTMAKGISCMPATAFQKMVRDDPTLPIVGVQIEEAIQPANLGLVRLRGRRLSSSALRLMNKMEEQCLIDSRLAEDFTGNRS